jgi:hypothetical protein
MLGVPILLGVKTSEGVISSSSESECVVMLVDVKEICCIFYLLRDMQVPVRLPIMVRINNIGSVFMTENSSSGARTKHINTIYHFIREHGEDALIKIMFVNKDKNDLDLFTKCEQEYLQETCD